MYFFILKFDLIFFGGYLHLNIMVFYGNLGILSIHFGDFIGTLGAVSFDILRILMEVLGNFMIISMEFWGMQLYIFRNLIGNF